MCSRPNCPSTEYFTINSLDGSRLYSRHEFLVCTLSSHDEERGSKNSLENAEYMRSKVIKFRIGARLWPGKLLRREKITKGLDYVILLFYVDKMNTTFNWSHKYFTQRCTVVCRKLQRELSTE
jgi:hypothetical protein